MELFTRYIIDTNIIIDITRRIYPKRLRDEAMAIVEDLISQGLIVSHQEVLEELRKGAKQGDVCLAWAESHSQLFVDFSPEQEVNLVTILAAHPDILDTKKEGSDADAPIIALAMCQGSVVVTGDGSGSSRSTKMKSVCDDYDIRCLTIDEFLTENGWLGSQD